MSKPTPDEKTYWLDEPRNVTKVFWSVVIACALLFGADAFYHKHAEFEAESWFGFYGIYGFVGSVALVLAAKGLRKILMRDEDYYDQLDRA